MTLDSICYIIDTTVDALEIKHSASIKMLIKMTFLMETQFKSVINKEHSRLGFMRMRKDKFKEFVNEYLYLKPELRKKIENTCLVNFKTDRMDDLIEALIYNISLQVCVTYAVYNSKYDKAPEIDVKDVAKKYINFWADEFVSDDLLKECVTRYNVVFSKR